MRKKVRKIVVVGGGFAGVSCALALARKKIPYTKIILISESSHFEYHAALYRLLTGRSPLEVCMPLHEIFDGYEVDIIEDRINSINVVEKELESDSGFSYLYDYLVLTVGGETAYFDTPGLKELSHTMKSIDDALKLKKHIHSVFESCRKNKTEEETICDAHFVVVGGGASGIEIAAELSDYARKLAPMHGIDPSMVTVDLIHSSDALLPGAAASMSKKIEKKIRSMGVNVYLNRKVMKEDIKKVYLKDMELKAKTVVWTAGSTLNSLLAATKGLSSTNAKRIDVNGNLQAKGQPDIYIGGDSAQTPFSGMDQTALYDGVYIANHLAHKLDSSHSLPGKYSPDRPVYAIPVGQGWAAIDWSGVRLYGRLGWWVRRYLDLRVFMTLLPLKKALMAFSGGTKTYESCLVCLEHNDEMEF